MLLGRARPKLHTIMLPELHTVPPPLKGDASTERSRHAVACICSNLHAVLCFCHCLRTNACLALTQGDASTERNKRGVHIRNEGRARIRGVQAFRAGQVGGGVCIHVQSGWQLLIAVAACHPTCCC